MEDLLSLANELMKDDNYKKTNYTEIPDGTYKAIIESIALKESQTGNTYVNFTLVITDGEFSERKLFVNRFLTEGAIKITVSQIMNLIKTCGYELEGDMFTDYETMVNCLQSLIGQEITVTKKTKGDFANYTMVGGAE
jgi:hypothetical protein